MPKTVIHSTANYNLIVLSEEERAVYKELHNELYNYAIVHKEYNTTEALFSVLYAAYNIIAELQSKLDGSKPSSPNNLRSIN